MATDQYQVVVYGASGYTGKLIAWKLAVAGIPFIAAGRDQVRVEAQMAAVPELKGHDYHCVGVRHDHADLVALFSGRKLVINVVGPFMQLGLPVVTAALQAGAHYLDTTGEQDWMFQLKREFGEKFRQRDLLLCPANSYMWAEGVLATELALETPGIDTLESVYLADSQVSVASTMSFLRMCTNPQYRIQNRELIEWPYATPYTVHVPGEHVSLNALPWSGGGEPVWYEGDSRVRNVRTLVSFKNQEAFGAVLGLLQKFEAECRKLPHEQREQVTNDWGLGMTTVEPPREDPDVNRCVLSCYGRGNTASVSVVLRGNSPYAQTGVFNAEAARRILSGKLKAVGFASPAAAFGARELIGAQAEQGYLAWEAASL
jgi:short subunit dehydrogenase-like uncharacterized protein